MALTGNPCRLKLKNYETAIDCFNKAIELNPKDEFAYNNRGRAKNALKQYDNNFVTNYLWPLFLLVCIGCFGVFEGGQFIYFQFYSIIFINIIILFLIISSFPSSVIISSVTLSGNLYPVSASKTSSSSGLICIFLISNTDALCCKTAL